MYEAINVENSSSAYEAIAACGSSAYEAIAACGSSAYKCLKRLKLTGRQNKKV